MILVIENSEMSGLVSSGMPWEEVGRLKTARHLPVAGVGSRGIYTHLGCGSAHPGQLPDMLLVEISYLCILRP